MSAPPSAPPAPRAGAREWLGLAMLALPTLLLATDITVLYLALPHLGADLQPTSTQTLWIVDIYGFLIAGFLVTMGTLGDRVGRRRLLMIGATGFGLAALAAAYASSPEVLIGARALMGVAGATLMPSTLALISTMFADHRQRTQAIAIWAASFSVGIAIGPLVGGGLLEHFWWGSVFLVDVPVIALLLVTAPLLLPEHRDRAAGRLDLTSVVLSLAAILAIVYGIKELAKDGVQPPALLALVIGAAAAVTFTRRQGRLTDPMVDLDLFRHRAFTVALGLLLLGTLAMGGVYLFVNQYLQMVEGLSPIAAGLWLLPPALALVVSAMVTPALARRARPAYVVAAGLGVSAAGYLLLTRVDTDSGLSTLVVGFLLVYAGFAPTFVLGTDLVVGSAPADKAGAASALGETSSELGVSLGVATLGSVGIAVYRNGMDGTVPAGTPAEAAEAARDSLTGAVATAEQLPAGAAAELLDPAREAFTNGLTTVAALGAAVIIALAVAVLRLLRDVGTEIPDGTHDDAGTGTDPSDGPDTPAGDRADHPAPEPAPVAG